MRFWKDKVFVQIFQFIFSNAVVLCIWVWLQICGSSGRSARRDSGARLFDGVDAAAAFCLAIRVNLVAGRRPLAEVNLRGDDDRGLDTSNAIQLALNDVNEIRFLQLAIVQLISQIVLHP